MSKFVLLGIALCFVLGCHRGDATNIKSDADITHNSDDHIDADGADIEGLDDPLETRVVVRVGSIGLNIQGKANFFRGYINKATANPIYQLYIQSKTGGGWKNWDNARYLSSTGLKEYPASRVATDARCNQYGCAYYEDILLGIDRITLEEWKEKDTTVRLTSSTINDHLDIDVSDGDAKDFLNAMDKVVAYLHKKSGTKTTGGVSIK